MRLPTRKSAPKKQDDAPPPHPGRPDKSWLILLAMLSLVFVVIFNKSFQSGMILFSNDLPLGGMKTEYFSMPQGLTGLWNDLNWVGVALPSLPPDFTRLLMLLFSPEMFYKVHVPLALLVLGLSAWLFVRTLGLHPMVCLLAGLAAALNSNAFSNACWGQISRPLSQAAVFLALAALQSGMIGRPWIKASLAGLAVGWAIMEGFDIGAIYSLYVAAFAVCLVLLHEQGKTARLGRAAGRVGMVALFAAFMAAHILTSLVETQLKGVAGMEQQDTESRAARWDFATQWSLPKVESLRVIIPGLFGYRMDTPDGGAYWGTVGQQPGWEHHGQGTVRFSGAGEYAGLFVVLVAFWGIAQSFRRSGNAFTPQERKLIWFWSGLAVVSLLFSWGRHAPFYQFVYAMPYFSTIRNPIKFMHPFHLIVVILFAYGMQGLVRLYLDGARTGTASAWQQVKAWWARAGVFEKRWTVGSLLALGSGVVAWLIYGASRKSVEQHLMRTGFDGTQAQAIAGFSLGEAGLFLLLLGLGAILLVLVQCGFFAGQRAKWLWSAAALFIIADLSRANLPWVHYHDYREKYAANPIIDFLAANPHEHRVALEIVPMTRSYLVQDEASLWPALANEWLQQHFQFYQVQSLDVIQFPRVPELDEAYLTAFRPRRMNNLFPAGRLWELTNTRFVIGETGMLAVLNQLIDPTHQPFRVHTAFDIVPKPGIFTPSKVEHLTVKRADGGKYALFENTRALPRAGLYSRWQTVPGDASALHELLDPDFDAHELVLVTGNVSGSAALAEPPHATGTVEYVHYEPKRVELRAQTDVPAVLLLNDRWEPNWAVTVNGEGAELLRCNYLMRGVYLEPGTHTVQFAFQPPAKGLYVSLAAIASGLVFGVVLLKPNRRREKKEVPGHA